jgi:hypothetical protein
MLLTVTDVTIEMSVGTQLIASHVKEAMKKKEAYEYSRYARNRANAKDRT